MQFSKETAPCECERHWVQTWPGTGMIVKLWLYGPLDSWFDKTWRPGEIEEVK
jgi:hypothetical protein